MDKPIKTCYDYDTGYNAKGAIIIIEFIVICAVLAVLAFIFGSFRPSPTQQIAENLYAVRCGIVNFYAYKTAGGVILFDTGTSAASARRGLDKLGIPAKTVTHIFLTHTDYDHASGIPAFPNAAVYMTDSEVQMINGDTARRGLIYNARISSYRTIGDGEVIDIDGTAIAAYVKPGHTPGSAAYLVDSRYLITGDLLRVTRSGGIKPFLWLMNMKHKQNIKSVEDSTDLLSCAQYILTGHTGFFKTG